MRKVPQVAYVARYYCPEQHTTFGLLPDFYASRMPGTLDAIEEAVALVEHAPSIEHAANEVRPAGVADAVTLPSAERWVRRRMVMVRLTLIAVLGLMPDRFEGCSASVASFRARLGTRSSLLVLREIASRHLGALPKPVGFNPCWTARETPDRRSQQRPGPAPPFAAP